MASVSKSSKNMRKSHINFLSECSLCHFGIPRLQPYSVTKSSTNIDFDNTCISITVLLASLVLSVSNVPGGLVYCTLVVQYVSLRNTAPFSSDCLLISENITTYYKTCFQNPWTLVYMNICKFMP